MKNPINYFKHLIKDPINTIEEANARKKEIMPWLFGSIALAVVPSVLGGAVDALSFLSIFGMIGIFATMFFGFLLWVILKSKERFAGLTCDKCGTLAEIKTSEDYAKYVSYTVETDEAIFKGYSGNKEPTNGVYSLVKFTGTSKAVVSVRLTCPHCGEVKHLKYCCVPFECYAEAKNVGAIAFPTTKMTLENAVRTAVNDYNNPDKKTSIPYTYQSTKNPKYEEKPRARTLGSSEVNIDYMGAKIHFHQDVEEMLEHYFVIPMINGTLTDPSKSKKSK